MLIPLDYRDEKILRIHEQCWQRTGRNDWHWPARHPYTSEYSWACTMLAYYLQCPPKQAKIMDAGGGDGSMQHYLATRYCECWNVDVKPRHLHASLPASILITSDLEETADLQPAAFDGILSASALEHNTWPKIIRIVRNLLSLLRPKAPLVVTVPALDVRHYYPYRGWPEPVQAEWPECYLFDAAAFREVRNAVADLADWITPAIPDDATYRAQWRAQHEDMMKNSLPQCQYPYLSTGFVLRRIA